MNESLKTIENMLEVIYSEIKLNTNNPDMTDKSYSLLKEAIVDTINLKRKVELARAFNNQN